MPLALRLGPTTWRVLIALLSRHRPCGPRELARVLGLSSHSVAIYHLEKLVGHGVVEKTPDGEYTIREDADLDVLDNYLFFQSWAIPRVATYAAFVTGLFLTYLVGVGISYTVDSGYALAIGISATLLLWAEAYRQWQGLA